MFSAVSFSVCGNLVNSSFSTGHAKNTPCNEMLKSMREGQREIYCHLQFLLTRLDRLGSTYHVDSVGTTRSGLTTMFHDPCRLCMATAVGKQVGWSLWCLCCKEHKTSVPSRMLRGRWPTWQRATLTTKLPSGKQKAFRYCTNCCGSALCLLPRLSGPYTVLGDVRAKQHLFGCCQSMALWQRAQNVKGVQCNCTDQMSVVLAQCTERYGCQKPNFKFTSDAA